jgi:paraquat-inducible protein B
MSKEANTKLVGAFVLGAVALIVIVFVIFGSGKFFQKTENAVIFFQGDVIGLRVGAPVKVRGVDVGSVTKINPIYDEKGEIQIEVIIKVIEGTVHDTMGYYEEMGEEEFYDYLIDKGLRARLETQSIVTGVRYIKLDFFPDSTINLVGLNKDHLEIPSTITSGEELNAIFERGLKTFDEIPLIEITHQLRDALVTANTTLASIDGVVNAPEVKKAIVSLSDSLNAVETFVEDLDEQTDPLIEDKMDVLITSWTETSQAITKMIEQSETLLVRMESIAMDDRYEIRMALQEIAKASRAMRQLVDHLQREPRSLISGKK